jgi:vacuolar protein sorting-associated protein 72
MEVKEQEKAEKRKAKSKGAYVDTAKRQRMTKAAPPSDDSESDNGGKTASSRDRHRRRAPTDSTPGDRRSGRQSTAQRSEASKSAAKEELRRRREMPKANKQEERRLTQEELLEEAKDTALENAKDLERLVRIEEELMRVDWSRAPLVGPRVIFHSTKVINGSLSANRADLLSPNRIESHLF